MVSSIRSVSGAPAVPFVRRLSPVGKTLVAVGTYAAWTALTWVLEGRIRTLLRPDATIDRLVYTGLANVVVGTVLALWVARAFVASGFTSRAELGFRLSPHSLAAVFLAAALGVAQYVAQQPASTDPVVALNVFAQVLPVSIAELVVCWVLVGGSVAALLRRRGRDGRVSDGVALLVASAFFGVYHFAHSPPFNSPEMVGLLTVVSVGTGLFYFVGRSAYGALVFHNFLALVGVVASLADAGRLGAYQEPLAPLLATALVALAALVGTERAFVRDPT